MKPAEILGMVEEAAGTRMFEEKKEKALRTIAKKDKKVEEFKAMIDEEITPKLDKLREEKRTYLAWQKTCTELEHIGRTLRAFEWTDATRRAAAKDEEIADVKEAKQSLENDKKTCGNEIKAAEKSMEEVNAQREKELKKGGKFKQLEEQVNELGKTLAKVRTQVEIKEATIADEEGKIAGSEKELEEVSHDMYAPRSLTLIFRIAPRQPRREAETGRQTECRPRTGQGQADRASDECQQFRGVASDPTHGPILEQQWKHWRRVHGQDSGCTSTARDRSGRGTVEPESARQVWEGAEGFGSGLEEGRARGQRCEAQSRDHARECRRFQAKACRDGLERRAGADP